MRMLTGAAILLLLLGAAVAGQGHVIGWGAWKPITLLSGQQIKVRSLSIDGRFKEYSTGASHQVTDTVTVARRVFRINNALPSETAQNPQWAWQLGGWIGINRTTGHISELKLPEFDVQNSEASWFQDYTAYCGTAEGENVHYMIVFEIGRRRPLLKKVWRERSCAAPVWDKDPTRVTFAAVDGQKLTFSVHDNIAELQGR